MNNLVVCDPWQQRFDEPDVCYHMFQMWLRQEPRCAPNDPGLATQFDWASRAMAYDQSLEIPSDPKTRLQYAFERSTRLACLGVSKLLRRELDSPDLQMDPRLLLRLLQTSFGLPAIAAGVQPTSDSWEIPDDTPQEDIDKLVKLLAKATKEQ